MVALVATLIANSENPVIDHALSDSLARELGQADIVWLAEGCALDLHVPAHLSADDARIRLAAATFGLPVDIAVQPLAGRRKQALVADMDSTMIGQECIDELADEAGQGEKVAEITRRAMNGELSFEPALRERVALLSGLPVSIIDKVLAERITLAPGARALIATMRANGAYTALVSGGFVHFTEKVAQWLGFDENQANMLVVEGDRLAGTVAEPILGRDAKREALLRISRQRSLATEQFMAVGDGANDLAMLELSGSGVALHAKPVVAEQARFRIDHGDLTALLYLQGYRREEFVG